MPGGASFPVESLLAWMNGNNQAFTDIAGTIPANTGNLLGLILEDASLGSNWQAASNAQRPHKDSNGVHFDYFGTTTPGTELIRAAPVNLNLNNCTMIVSIMARDASNSPQNGLLRALSTLFGIFSGNGQIAANYNAGTQWVSALTYQKAVATVIAIRWTPTGLFATMLVAGTFTDDSVTVAVTPGVVSTQLLLGDGLAGAQGFYGSQNQAMVFNRALNVSELRSAMQFCAAQAQAVAFPLTSPLFGIMGDSIPRSTVGVAAHEAYAWLTLADAKAIYPNCEMVNVAVVGAGAGLPDYTPIIPYYSASRARNVCLVAVGTNNLANGAGANTAQTLIDIYAQCDAAKAAGWRVALATILPRSGLFNNGTTQSQFNAAMTTANADIIANWASHANALINTTIIAGMGTIGDSNNATNYSDLVHPTAVGMALLKPAFSSVLLGLAA